MTNKFGDDTPENGDDEYGYDPTAATDAGDGEEMQEAVQETKKVALRRIENKASFENYLDDVRLEADIVKRGRKIMQGNLVSFPDTKKTAEGFIALNSDTNRVAAFEALFGSGENRPHINTFSGRLVDWKGEVIDDQYSMVPMLASLHAMGLRLQAVTSIKASLRDWGLQVKTNDLIVSVNKRMPEWDGVKRLEDKLIKLFGSFDTELNRDFGRYFWLSLYCRIMVPGCMAPMALSLFGAQDSGKSYFSKLICRELLGDDKANPVQLDLGADKLGFLRDITGNAIIANIGEMTGFTRSDLNAIKAFMTATADAMHQKFEGHFTQQRQWISIMDGNKYEGLQRDDTGNRRFYPQFVGQLPDRHGQPDWVKDFKADFTGFAADLWQIMAECREWLLQNGGMDGYNAYVEKVSRQVQAFSQSEMDKGRGVVVDYSLDTYLVPALINLRELNAEIIKGSKKRGMWITTADLKTRIKYMSRGGEVKDNHLKSRMMVFGAKADLVRNVRGYLFEGIMDEAAYLKVVRMAETDDDVETLDRFMKSEESRF